MISAAAPSPPGQSAAADSAGGYFASGPHYRAVAGRIVAALGERSGIVLVTGDPPPRAEDLAQALRQAAPLRWRPVVLACGPQLSRHELRRAAGIADAAAGEVPEAEAPVFASRLRQPAPLLLFEAADQLSESQLAEVFAAAPEPRTAVLLADPPFPTRLSAIDMSREQLRARLRFQELAADEVDGFIRHQLGDAGAFPPEIVQAIASAAGGDPALVDRLARLVLGFAAGSGTMPSGKELARSAQSRGPEIGPLPDAPTRPAARGGRRSGVVVICLALLAAGGATAIGIRFGLAPALPPAARNSPPAAEIGALLARGDGFRAAGDIASARLFYERAAAAGSGPAALRLGEAFDPGLLDRAGVRGVRGDPAAARAWYRKARDLGIAEAARRLRDIDTATPKPR